MKSLFLGVTIILSLLLVPKAFAASCQPIYGGGQTCTNATFSIQNQVLNPQTTVFVHDLGMNDPKYHGNDLIPFQVTLSNNGDQTIKQVTVTDSFPKELRFSDGPGKFDPQTNTLTFVVNDLAPHHAKLFTINAYAQAQSNFPQETICINNQISALPSSGSPAQDSSQVCLTKITSTPSTGTYDWSFVLLAVTTVLGFGIRKRAHLLLNS